MKGDVLAQPDIKRRLDTMIFAELYTDRGTPDDEANRELRVKKYGVALPGYLVLSPDGVELSRAEGQMSVEEFAAFLDRGLKP